jgi:hypothetical protein
VEQGRLQRKDIEAHALIGHESRGHRYCLHALTGAGSLPSKAAVRRLVDLTMDGLQPRS